MMPPQLARAKRPKRATPRPLVETLPRLDIIDLCRWKVFPSQYDWQKAHYLEAPFQYPFVKSFVIALQTIEVNHYSGYIFNQYHCAGFALVLGDVSARVRCLFANVAAA